MSVGEKIRFEMMKQGLTAADLASKAGCSVATIYNVLRNQAVRETTLFRILKVVDLANDYKPSQLLLSRNKAAS